MPLKNTMIVFDKNAIPTYRVYEKSYQISFGLATTGLRFLCVYLVDALFYLGEKFMHYVLLMICLGGLLGSIINENATMILLFIVAIIIISIYGIMKQYLKTLNKDSHSNISENNNSNVNYKTSTTLSLLEKTNRLRKDPNLTENINTFDIVNVLINLLDAKVNLSLDDFNNVYKIYKYFENKDKIICVNNEMFEKYVDYIMSTFDLIAPYFKFCGNEKLCFLEVIDEEKQSYRKKANLLISQNKHFSQEWIDLHTTFFDKFYK